MREIPNEETINKKIEKKSETKIFRSKNLFFEIKMLIINQFLLLLLLPLLRIVRPVLGRLAVVF